MECKVKIGISYEPKWFERRQTNGYYSGKNPPLDSDGMWLQNALIGTPSSKRLTKWSIVASAWLSGVVAYLSFFM
jgi:hypothetical protein